jgi:signal transduction histidine kinase
MTTPRSGSGSFLGIGFQYRILLLVAGLLLAGMGGLLLAMLRWSNTRTEDDIRYRLARATEILGRVHREESALRARRFESLSTEPRFLALAQVMAMKGGEETLKEQLEEYDLQKRGWAGFGFSLGTGEILGWKGKGRPAGGAPLARRLRDSAEPVLELHGDELLELFTVGLRAPSGAEPPTGYLLVAAPFSGAVLREYAISAGGTLELVRTDGRAIEAPDRVARSALFPVSPDLSFRFTLNTGQVAAPRREMLRTLALVAVGVVLLGSVAAFLVAHRMSRPIGALAAAARKVGEGRLDAEVAQEGAPELRSLARDFNEMVASLRRSREEIKEKAAEILDVGERERERLAQDLHDGLGQDLAGISLHCQALVKKLSEGSGGQEAERIAGLVRRAIETARTLGRGLYPLGLETNDLERSIREMAVFIRQTWNVPVLVEWDPRIRIEDRMVATHLYWIAQEAATNAAKHAKAGTLWIRLWSSDAGGATLTVRDDGIGLSEPPPSRGGMGLRIMRSRSEMIGAEFRVGPHPEGGTWITCDVTRGIRLT